MATSPDPAPAPPRALADPFATSALTLLGMGGVLLTIGALGPRTVAVLGALAILAALVCGGVHAGAIARSAGAGAVAPAGGWRDARR